MKKRSSIAFRCSLVLLASAALLTMLVDERPESCHFAVMLTIVTAVMQAPFGLPLIFPEMHEQRK